MIYVFDTNIWVAALRSRRGASFLVLKALRQRLVIPAVLEALFLEYTEVLKRDENLQNFWISSEEVDVVLNVIADVCQPVPIYFQWRPQLSDPDDEMVLECAINAQAQAIVTFNTQDFLPAAQLFGIEVVKPGSLVQSLKLQEEVGE